MEQSHYYPQSLKSRIKVIKGIAVSIKKVECDKCYKKNKVNTLKKKKFCWILK